MEPTEHGWISSGVRLQHFWRPLTQRHHSLPNALLPEVRLLAQLGMSETDLLPLLGAYASAGMDVWMPPTAPGWLLYRLPLSGAAVGRADDSASSAAAAAVTTPVWFPADALLVLGWDALEHEPASAALRSTASACGKSSIICWRMPWPVHLEVGPSR